MHFHICGQELALVSTMLPYLNMGFFYVCHACEQMSKKVAWNGLASKSHERYSIP